MALMGKDEAIEWIVVLFVAGILSGALIYSLVEFNTSINNSEASSIIGAFLDIFDIIPSWIKILVIVGFTSAIAIIGLVIYRYFKSESGTM